MYFQTYFESSIAVFESLITAFSKTFNPFTLDIPSIGPAIPDLVNCIVREGKYKSPIFLPHSFEEVNWSNLSVCTRDSSAAQITEVSTASAWTAPGTPKTDFIKSSSLYGFVKKMKRKGRKGKLVNCNLTLLSAIRQSFLKDI